jgi:hypothetical protein
MMVPVFVIRICEMDCVRVARGRQGRCFGRDLQAFLACFWRSDNKVVFFAGFANLGASRCDDLSITTHSRVCRSR